MDLDAILDKALDDFDEQEFKKRAAELKEDGLDNQASVEADEEDRRRQKELQEMMESMQDPSYGPVLQDTLKQLSGTSEGAQSVESLFEQLSKNFETDLKPSYLADGPDDANGVAAADREVTATLQMIGSAQQGMEGMEAGKMEAAGEGMMEEMMAQFEALGEKEDYNEVRQERIRYIPKFFVYKPLSN